jgi:hypothetical protein
MTFKKEHNAVEQIVKECFLVNIDSLVSVASLVKNHSRSTGMRKETVLT